MALIQMLGFGSFIVASLILGVRLLLLWRRTREVPELAMGLSFLVGGAFGYSAWFGFAVAQMAGTELADLRAYVITGLGFTCLGAFTIALGIRAAFRPGDRLSLGLLSTFAVLMGVGWLDTARNTSGQEHWQFWLAMLTAGACYVWSCLECVRLSVLLGKRARFGLASPLIAERARLWALAFGAVVVMILSSFLSRLVLGPNVVPPPWVSSFQSLCGLACATAIWFGFFPPEFYRRRFAGRAPVAA